MNTAAEMAPKPMHAKQMVKVPASPPFKLLATKGKRAISAVELKKKMAIRIKTPWKWADCEMN